MPRFSATSGRTVPTESPKATRGWEGGGELARAAVDLIEDFVNPGAGAGVEEAGAGGVA